MIKNYANMTELALEYESLVKGYDRFGGGGNGGAWYNHEAWRDSVRYAKMGNTLLVPQAEEMLDKLDSVIEVRRPRYFDAPAGAFPCVPNAIRGLPTSMKCRELVEDDNAPINIYVCVSSSVGVNSKTLLKRGVAVLALVLVLSRIRAVNLYTIHCGDGKRDKSGETVLVTQINTAPLDTASACHALTSSGYVRRLNYEIAAKLNNYSGRWPASYGYGGGGVAKKYYDSLAIRMGCDLESTLIIPGCELHDELAHKPIEWINAQIKRFTPTALEEDNEDSYY